MKSTPKSCSCAACKRGKSANWGKWQMKKDERSFRHKTNTALKQGKEVTSAPVGNYYD